MDANPFPGLTELVVQGVVDQSVSRLASDGTSVETTYQVRVEDVLFSRTAVSPSRMPALSVIEMKQSGGTVVENGQTIQVADATLPRFTLGTRFVLYLQRDADAADVYLGARDARLGADDAAGNALVRADLQIRKLHTRLGLPAYVGVIQAADLSFATDSL